MQIANAPDRLQQPVNGSLRHEWRPEIRHEDVAREDDAQLGQMHQQPIGGLAAGHRIKAELHATK